jgi:hypothetical protein
MSFARYAVCAVLLVASVANAKHHKKTEVVQTERTEVSEPVQAGVGEPVVIEEGAPVPEGAPLPQGAPLPEGAQQPQGVQPAQPVPGEVRSETRTEIRTEGHHGRCETCRPCKVRCGKADIETLKGKACCSANGLQSTLRYKVETKNIPPGQLELLMRFSDHGRLIADDKGQPYTVAVSLDRPSDTDEHEMEYRGSLPIPIPAGPWHDDLRIEGQVVTRPDGKVLDEDHGKLELPD